MNNLVLPPERIEAADHRRLDDPGRAPGAHAQMSGMPGGYVTAGTGLGLSLAAATQLRVTLLILCVLSLLYHAAKRLSRFAVIGRKQTARWKSAS